MNSYLASMPRQHAAVMRGGTSLEAIEPFEMSLLKEGSKLFEW